MITTIYSLEDSYVRQGTPTTNYGSLTEMVCGYHPLPSWKKERVYIKFDISSVAPSIINSATINFRQYQKSGGTFQTHVVKRVYSGSWTEGTISWNNQPYFTNTNKVLWNPESYQDKWHSVNITVMVQTQVNQGGELSVCLIEEPEIWELGDTHLYTTETASPAYLTIDYTPIYTISGIVYNNESTPIQNATVTINDTELLTNQDGYYEATVESGTYDLSASKECYSEDSATIEITNLDVIQDFIIDCIECEICEPCPPDKLDWWLLIVGVIAGHLLKRSKKNDKR